jgi:Calcineurin-like phosphoesterase
LAETWFVRPPASPGRLFGEPSMGPDETSFQVQNTDAAYYASPYYKLHQSQLQPIPTGPPASPFDLAEVISADALAAIEAAKKIVFHSVGDTGASMAIRLATEAGVADAMTADLQAPLGEAPSFLFHLGDVIYNFGEAQYYYDQFYEPFRGYNRPIFAIPGNHDGEVQYGADPSTPLAPTLLAFLRNFCAPRPGASPDSGGLVRSSMTQPGAYFTLDAPFVSIIGLYSNVLETFGVISSQGGRYSPSLDDTQLEWLTAELERLKAPRENLERAVLVACHHPPASADRVHGGGVGHAHDIDLACGRAGLWPDAILSGHAHLYQRFTRSTGQREIPYIVAGSGGHDLGLPRGEVLGKTPLTWGEYTLVHDPILRYGYLTITVDMTDAARPTLAIRFRAPADPSAVDQVTVDLSTHAMTGD